MSVQLPRASQVNEVLTRRQLTRAVVASTVGNAIDFYDFALYGLVASLYLGKLYFPQKDPLSSTLVAFVTFLVGFIARPVGAAIFGHFGDRIGRKATLIATLALMGVATFAIGLVPTYADIGIAGGLILVALRVLQGIGVGGEWGGSVLLAIEWANQNKRRGLMAAFPQVGAPFGTALATLALGLSTAILGQSSYWGWRVPFLISIVLVLVGLYIRLGILETPVFAKLLEERRTVRIPIVAVLQRQWREVVLVALMRTGQQGITFIFAAFVLTYGTLVLHMPQGQLIAWVVVATFLEVASGLLWAHVGDRIGRRRMLLIGMVAMGLFAYPYWALLDTRMPILVAVAILLSLPIHDMQYGPQAGFIPETFTGRLRYSGASLGYHLSGAIAGGTGPLIAAALFQRYHSSTPIAFYMIGCVLISIVATLMLRDSSHRDLSVEFDDAPARQEEAVVPGRARAY